MTALISFTLAAALLKIAPGLDTAIGICVGGLGALLAASQRAYEILRSTGAAYLLYLGIGMLVHPRSSFTATAGSKPEGGGRETGSFAGYSPTSSIQRLESFT